MKNLALIKNYNLDYSKLINYFIVLYAFSIKEKRKYNEDKKELHIKPFFTFSFFDSGPC